MSFLHLADLHIGKGRKLPDYLARQKAMLNEIIGVVNSQSFEFVLLAGDVFHRKDTTESERNIVIDFLCQLDAKAIPVYIIPGNHDHIEGTLTQAHLIELLTRHNNFKHIKVILNDCLIKNGTMSILFLPWLYGEEGKNWVGRANALINSDEQIGDFIICSHVLIKGSVSDTGFSPKGDEIKGLAKKPKYCALGDIHIFQCVNHNYNAWYSGAPIQGDYGEQLPKGIVKVSSDTFQPDLIELKTVKPLIVIQAETKEEIEEISKRTDAIYRIKVPVELAGVISATAEIIPDVGDVSNVLDVDTELADEGWAKELSAYLASLGLTTEHQTKALNLLRDILA